MVHNSIMYRLDISDITFSQTFTEHSYSNKTLQVENMFEQSVINKANPANFALTIPALRESDMQVLFNRAIDYQSFDLYIHVDVHLFKIEGCVITNATFNIPIKSYLSISITGEGIRVTKEATDTIPVAGATLKARSPNRTYIKVDYVRMWTPVIEKITVAQIELQNNIQWVPYDTVNAAREALDTDSSMYPSKYVIKDRNLSGSITSYDIETPTWNEVNWMLLQAGERVGPNQFFGFRVESEAIFTTNINTNDIFTQTHRWRSLENPESLSEVLKYETIIDDGWAIQDSTGVNILDSDDYPIFENF